MRDVSPKDYAAPFAGRLNRPLAYVEDAGLNRVLS